MRYHGCIDNDASNVYSFRLAELARSASKSDWMVLSVTVLATALILFEQRRNLSLALVLGCIAIGAGILSAIDLRSHRLPNRGTLALAILSTVGLGLVGAMSDQAERLPVAVGSGIALLIVFFLVHLVAALGMGDVKYAYTIGCTTGWFGFPTLMTALLITSATAAIGAAAVLIISRDSSKRIPYGPFMSLGLAAAILVS